MLERLLVTTVSVLRTSARAEWDIQALGNRLNRLNARRLAQIESITGLVADNAADKARAELIHFFGRIAESKIRTRL